MNVPQFEQQQGRIHLNQNTFAAKTFSSLSWLTEKNSRQRETFLDLLNL